MIEVVVALLLHNNGPVKLPAVNTELPQLLTTATVGAAGTALFRRHGAIGDFQQLADRAGGRDLPCYAVAARAPGQQARTAARGLSR